MKKALFYLISFLLICGGVSEGYARYKGFLPYDTASYKNAFRNYYPVLGWVPEIGEHELTFRTDRKAFETVWPDTARASRKQQNHRTAKNILLVGCSYTYGHELDDTETWPWLLSERFPEVTFDNYGVVAYGTYQSLLREQQQLATGKQYDCVIYTAIQDHLNRNYDIACFMGELKNNRPYYLQPRVDLDEEGRLIYFSELPARWFLDNVLATVELSKRSYYRYLIQFYKDNNTSLTEKKQIIFQKLVQQMHDTAEAHHSKFLLCILENTVETFGIPDPKQYEYPLILATNGHEGEDDSPKFHVNGEMLRHPNGRVNKTWAKIIGDYLVKNKYVTE